jgi:hypothetical protein
MMQSNDIIDLSYIENDNRNDTLETKGRNSRKPKKSNHGARPCSSYMRKLKLKGWYHKLRGDWTATI